MADLIQIKGGSGDVPILQDRELAYEKNTKSLYIGTGNVNRRLCGADDYTVITAKLTEINEAIESINARLAVLET